MLARAGVAAADVVHGAVENAAVVLAGARWWRDAAPSGSRRSGHGAGEDGHGAGDGLLRGWGSMPTAADRLDALRAELGVEQIETEDMVILLVGCAKCAGSLCKIGDEV